MIYPHVLSIAKTDFTLEKACRIDHKVRRILPCARFILWKHYGAVKGVLSTYTHPDDISQEIKNALYLLIDP